MTGLPGLPVQPVRPASSVSRNQSPQGHRLLRSPLLLSRLQDMISLSVSSIVDLPVCPVSISQEPGPPSRSSTLSALPLSILRDPGASGGLLRTGSRQGPVFSVRRSPRVSPSRSPCSPASCRSSGRGQDRERGLIRVGST